MRLLLSSCNKTQLCALTNECFPFGPSWEQGNLSGWSITTWEGLRTSATKERNRTVNFCNSQNENCLYCLYAQRNLKQTMTNFKSPNNKNLLSAQWGGWFHNYTAGVTMLWSRYKPHVNRGQFVTKKWAGALVYLSSLLGFLSAYTDGGKYLTCK